MDGEEAPPGALNLADYAPAGARTVDCFRRIRKIGEGTYGEVFEAMDIITGERAALKKIKLDDGKEGVQHMEQEDQYYMEQLLKGLHYCHVNNVLHRDIKDYLLPFIGANLLISGGGKLLKLADFGLARPFTRDGSFTNHVITLWYRPPELLLGATNYAEAVDIWSVGCIFAEFLLRKPLFPGRTEV
uniref:[RNA-polymerase]-subunit kinase n=3 Tax=Oryza TaxID=4527 RepID=A0A0E0QJU3_ORYRU